MRQLFKALRSATEKPATCLTHPVLLNLLRSVQEALAVGSVGLALGSCAAIATDQYMATAFTRYTWLVEYAINPQKPATARVERFASTMLVNCNGLRPPGAVTGPDDRGLWWPALPPRPTLDEIEERRQPLKQVGTPQLLKSVKYELTYQVSGRTVTLSTNYSVYRQVGKAYLSKQPLKFTLGIGQRSVWKAEPQ